MAKSPFKAIYNIGFVEFDDSTIFKPFKIRWLKHSSQNSWFADPFILDVCGNEISVLVEEFVAGTQLGRISKLEILRDGNGDFVLQKIVPLLENSTHFSFPAILRRGNEIFVYPENSDHGNGNLQIYKLENDKLVPAGTLCDLPLADAVITDFFGEDLMFATIENQDPNGNELTILKREKNSMTGSDGALAVESKSFPQANLKTVPEEASGRADGEGAVVPSATNNASVPAKFVPVATIKFPERTARGGGDFFKIRDKNGEGIVVRVAQDNNKNYGGAIVFYKCECVAGTFKFTELARHFPVSPRYSIGTHTFNIFGNLAVVDGNGIVAPFKRFRRNLRYKIHQFFTGRPY